MDIVYPGSKGAAGRLEKANTELLYKLKAGMIVTLKLNLQRQVYGRVK